MLKLRLFFSFFVQLQIVRCRLALKHVERFRNGSVRKTYERSLYGRTFINKPSSRNMLYQLNYPMLIERSINANPMVYIDVFFSKCLIHFFQSIHDNDIFEVREVYIENIQNRIVYQNSVNETTNI